MYISHRIELAPNNKQKSYFQKAIRVREAVYNWGLTECNRVWAEEGKHLWWFDLNSRFAKSGYDAVPEARGVSFSVNHYALKHLDFAFQNYFRELKKNPQGDIHPKYHKVDENKGSFWIDGHHVHVREHREDIKYGKSLRDIPNNINGKYQYIFVPRLGDVKMKQRLRFNGKVESVCISRKRDRYFVSFVMNITEEEYWRTHKPLENKGDFVPVGIDLGIKSAMVTSDGERIIAPMPDAANAKEIKRIKRIGSRYRNPDMTYRRSRKFKRWTDRVSKKMTHIANIKREFQFKIANALTSQYTHICMETLDVKSMGSTNVGDCKAMRRRLKDISMNSIREHIENKCIHTGRTLMLAPRLYPSSKLCSNCGHKYRHMPLSVRTYECPDCGMIIDRDLNAAINLRQYMIQQIGIGDTESTPVDSLQLDGKLNKHSIKHKEVEIGLRLPKGSKSSEAKGRLLNKIQHYENFKLARRKDWTEEEEQYLYERQRQERQLQEEQRRAKLESQEEQLKERIMKEAKNQLVHRINSSVFLLFYDFDCTNSIQVEMNNISQPLYNAWVYIKSIVNNERLKYDWVEECNKIKDTSMLGYFYIDVHGERKQYHAYTLDALERLLNRYGESLLRLNLTPATYHKVLPESMKWLNLPVLLRTQIGIKCNSYDKAYAYDITQSECDLLSMEFYNIGNALSSISLKAKMYDESDLFSKENLSPILNKLRKRYEGKNATEADKVSSSIDMLYFDLDKPNNITAEISGEETSVEFVWSYCKRCLTVKGLRTAIQSAARKHKGNKNDKAILFERKDGSSQLYKAYLFEEIENTLHLFGKQLDGMVVSADIKTSIADVAEWLDIRKIVKSLTNLTFSNTELLYKHKFTDDEIKLINEQVQSLAKELQSIRIMCS